MRRLTGFLAVTVMLGVTAVGVVRTIPQVIATPPIWSLARAEPGPAGGSEGVLAAPEMDPSPTPLPTLTPTPAPTMAAAATPTATTTPSPTPTTVVVSRAIFVDQDAQVMHVYENGVQIRRLPCSTGLPQPWKGTPAWVGKVGRYVDGVFSYGLHADDGWYLFKASGDILIHGAPYTWVDGAKVYQDLDALGHHPSSHGCIRLRPEDARWLTEWNPQGVPIAISPLTREISP